ncbi:TrkH family potassium uptake protein [Salidesulfovibrio onnuriiensis]|uniref:TrkH family potassium uptake protein n=1 Tax=Salidesulfovibrio onnuriiensis TaxID=2583823 RepID=UPI0011CBF604|nr:potassium transporter TrkG [Salidesulfovibrio onnuriiensis]
MRIKLFSPFWMPVWFFAGAILAGASLLAFDPGLAEQNLSWIDAVFTATSAMCVTGLVVVDTGSAFSHFGQMVILVLIQLGGLGIMTFTSLAMYLMGRHVSLSDRISVGQSLLHDPRFSLRNFLFRVICITFGIELVGAMLLWLVDPQGFHPYSALFHSISAFCNAGFSLYADSLSAWHSNWSINFIFMALITLGGLGFYVLNECGGLLTHEVRARLSGKRGERPSLSWHSSVVLRTSVLLSLGGAAAIFTAELFGGESFGIWHEELLSALFQSVTCRTAGFNTVDIAHMTNVSLVFMLFLMLVGGSPGSCAGGIKTTTLRAVWGFICAQFAGRQQTVIGKKALASSSMNKAFTLLVFAGFIVAGGAIILNISEGGDVPHIQARGNFLEILFEVISAYGTVGLSTGMTGKLTSLGKVVVIMLMFIGRLGPIWLLSALQSWQVEQRFRYPERDLPLG